MTGFEITSATVVPNHTYKKVSEDLNNSDYFE